MILIGEFKKMFMFKEVNTKNLTTQCRCRFLTLNERTDGIIEFTMKAKCLKHILKYSQWKLSNTAVNMNGLKLDYKYNQYSDGRTEVIK